MRRPTALAVLLVVLIVALAGGLLFPRQPKTPIDMNHLVTDALYPGQDSSYVAQVSTSINYCGRKVTSNATVFRSGGAEKLTRGSDRTGVWSLSREDASYTYVPSDRTLLVSRASSMLTPNERAKLLLKNYNPVYRGVEDVAGREAYVVELLPSIAQRPYRKLWIDKEHHTVLRSVDYSADGSRRGGTVTTKIAYNTVIDSQEFDLPRVKRLAVCEALPADEMVSELKFRVSKPRYIPAGFVPEGRHLFRSNCPCNHLSAQLTYTDGLNLISVFESLKSHTCSGECCDMPGGSGGCEVSGCGMTNTGTITRGGKKVVVVADLPADEIRKIAESVD